ncbi:DUF397 domain-containing protein [Streptomyces sp. SID3915]|uniref:DUF397 domain-containing protein n=1 Tax=Streptomyces sp. SID3915 TaxID=2690263 RepID=UPI001368B697|nr:DUF397 domain-containing protein [Streptomyces sp. SID3915]MYX77612.1 DUF397 domain-containing protein [Streptomyces sp. SID3915]
MTNSPAQPTDRPDWYKSSYSEGSGNACVEVAIQASKVLVRDSKDLTTPYFGVSTAAWSAFVDHATR